MCGCSGAACGVNRTHGQIWLAWSAHYVSSYFNEFDAKRCHVKWKALGKAASKPGWK